MLRTLLAAAATMVLGQTAYVYDGEKCPAGYYMTRSRKGTPQGRSVYECTLATLDGGSVGKVAEAYMADAAITAQQLAADPADCTAGKYATAINASGALTCSSVGKVAEAYMADASITAQQLAADPADCTSNQYATAINASGALTCNSVGKVAEAYMADASITAQQLAADPADCASNQYATAINASGTLTCTSVGKVAEAFMADASITAQQLAADPGDCAPGKYATAINASGTLACDTIGKVAEAYMADASITAQQLAADPADCSAGNYATAINASGTLTCSNPPGRMLSATFMSYGAAGTKDPAIENADMLGARPVMPTAVSVANVYCSWGITGAVSGVTDTIQVAVRKNGTGGCACSLNIDATGCDHAIGTPFTCNCSASWAAGDAVSLQIVDATNCATNPGEIVCNVILTVP